MAVNRFAYRATQQGLYSCQMRHSDEQPTYVVLPSLTRLLSSVQGLKRSGASWLVWGMSGHLRPCLPIYLTANVEANITTIF